ncbi:hypothetical protein [Dactylosporangium sp. CA-092794]|uniref:hypothetical protein n=1 Tax=Dactylosporangium sp. CA-092794 TaxID=3239929 RepID=UPI003D8B8B02
MTLRPAATAQSCLRDGLGDAGERVATRALPDFAVRTLALVNSRVRPMVHELGGFKPPSNERARRVLGWQPRSAEGALIATGESLLRRGLIKRQPFSGTPGRSTPATSGHLIE